MAKRFIDNNIFKKSFIRGLEGPSKLLWIYLFCDCDNAGIWEVDFEIASIYTGFPVDYPVLEKFGNKIVFFDEGKKVFLPEFISFQYGELNRNNPAHKGAISQLIKYQLIDENLKAPSKHLQSTYKGAKDMDMDKDMDIRKGGVGEKQNSDEKPEQLKTWKTDFETYKSELLAVYQELIINPTYITTQEKFHPGVDISLSLEKAVTNFWATEAGWKHKKKQRARDPDWKMTLTNAINKNKVYKSHGNNDKKATSKDIRAQARKQQDDYGIFKPGDQPGIRHVYIPD